MADPFLSTAFSGVLDMLRPSKSPFGLIALAGSSALALCASPDFLQTIGQPVWLATAALLLVTQTLVVLGAIRSRNVFGEKDYREHIRFARSVSIAASLVGLVWILREIRGTNASSWRWGHLVATTIQILVFFGYSLAAWAERDESVPRVNFVQIALVSVILLLGAGFARISCFEDYGDSDEESIVGTELLVVVPVAMYMLWALCTAAIVRHLLRYVRIRVRTGVDSVGGAQAMPPSPSAPPVTP